MFFNEDFEKYNGVFDESKFIIGLDIGNNDSALSFFDFNTGKIEQLDISGGYGKSSVPSVVQYIKDTGEWVFGEYALMNKPLSDSITFDNLISELGKNNCYAVGRNTLSHSYILGLFIKELIDNIKSINPNGEIIGIGVAVTYLNESAEKELLEAFSYAGYYEKLIGFFPSKECILNKVFFDESEPISEVVTLDFGSREIRGGIYNLFENDSEIVANLISAFFESDVGTSKIEKRVYDIFEEYFKENTGETEISEIHKLQLEAFTYQHKDLLFKSKKDIKLYFNFAYPPFQKNIEKDFIEGITLEFKSKFYKFLEMVFESAEKEKAKKKTFKIDKVICCGGGFEMIWIKQAVINIFGEKRCVFYKNPKNVISFGACIIAGKFLGAVQKKNVLFLENATLTQDIGLVFRGKDEDYKFVPFIEKGVFWWQKFESKRVIINEVDGPPSLEIFKRDKDGNLIMIERIVLTDLPKRPKGTNCFDILFEYIESNKILVKIRDMGFGGFFEKTDYEKNFIFDIV